MSSVNEWSSEYHLEVDKIDDWDDSAHSYNKKVVYFKPKKDSSGNYRFRFVLQMNPASNGDKTIAIEMFFKDRLLWNKSLITISSVGLNDKGNITKKII